MRRDGDPLLEWALNLVVLNVSTRKYRRAVRLPEGDRPGVGERLERVEPGVAGSILEGLEEILTVIRLGLPQELRRSLACTNIIENALGTVRQVSRNVKRWSNAEMALKWTAAGLLEAQKSFRRLAAYRQLPSSETLSRSTRKRLGPTVPLKPS